MDANKLIQTYVATRDAIAEQEARHKEELAPLKQKLNKIEAGLHKTMNDAGVRQVKGTAGTAYIQERVSARVDDWQAVLDYICESAAWDLLERRVAKNAVIDRTEAGEEVPGVFINRDQKVNIRRS